MARSYVTIGGKLLQSSAGGVSLGTIETELSEPGISGGDAVAVERQLWRTASDGTVSITLTPNDDITPAGTWYRARFELEGPGELAWDELWQVGTADTDVGEITRL